MPVSGDSAAHGEGRTHAYLCARCASILGTGLPLYLCPVARLSSLPSPYSSSSAYPTLSNASAGPSVADATWTPEMVWNTNFVDVYSANLAWLSVEKCVFVLFLLTRYISSLLGGEDFFRVVFSELGCGERTVVAVEPGGAVRGAEWVRG
jgi:hypothetical protein